MRPGAGPGYVRLVHERHRQLWLDGALGTASFAAFTLPVLVSHGGEGASWSIGLLGGIVAGALWLRRRWPIGVLLVVATALGVAALAGVRFTPFVSNAGPAIPIAVYGVATGQPRRGSAVWTAGALMALESVTLLALLLHARPDQDAIQALLAVPAWIAGDAARLRRRYRQELADQRAVREREREARIRAEERVRMSREIHDVISHALSMIALRSAVAREVAESDPGEARESLAAIEQVSRRALDEVRSALRAIRDPVDGSEPAQPALADLPTLITPARAAGLDVSLEVEALQCSPTLETTIFRIVQEALTNVVKHARARRVTVRVSRRGGEVDVLVSDDGVGRTPASADGLGTTGMRERVDLFGGALELSPGDGGRGHRVHAAFPLGASGA